MINYLQVKWNCQLTIPVGQQTHQAVEACVRDFCDAGCTSAYSLNSGCCKLFILAFHIGLKNIVSISSAQSLRGVQLFVIPWTAALPGLPVHHQLLELTQTHVHQVGDAIQPSHPRLSPSPAFNLSQHQSVFHWISSSHKVAKVLELQLQRQSFQWLFRTDFL